MHNKDTGNNPKGYLPSHYEKVLCCGYCGCCCSGWLSVACCFVVVVVVIVVVVVVVVVVYLKRLRIVLRCAKAGCGRRTSSS